MTKDIEKLISLGYKLLEQDEDNILFVNEKYQIGVLLMDKFDFKSDFTNNAIKILEKYKTEYKFLEKKTFCYIKNFLDDKEKILTDLYFFHKNDYSDLFPIIERLKRLEGKKIIFEVAKNSKDVQSDYWINPYLELTSTIRKMFKVMPTIKTDTIIIKYPIVMKENIFYLKYLFNDIVREIEIGNKAN